MKESLKNKNLLVIVFEIIVIILGIVGITLATNALINNRTSTLLTASTYDIDYKGDKEINMTDLEPISDDLININTTDKVVRIEFSLRGVKSNKDDDKLIYDVMLNDMNIDCSLLNKYTKWNLYKNNVLLSTGSLDPSFDGDILTDNMHLTEIEQDLPKYNQEYDNYVLIFWISESCDDLTTCELVDQSMIANSHMSMNVFIALLSGTKKQYVRTPNNSNSCTNSPVMLENMTPVTYKDGTWVVANSNNSDPNNLWYNYNDGKWANAVILNGGTEKNVGSEINNKDVLAWYVWIPRFRYKLWNATKEITDSYNAYDNGISIIFENGLNSISNTENDSYLTHPAFGTNLKGFWISKYELSYDNNTYKFINNSDAYRKDSLENYKTILNNITTNYKLGANTESHMVNNLEWGATLYLSHSKYGVCKNNGCDKIDNNLTYISGNNKQDTTTRNVYGVYDMAGGSAEYVDGLNNGLGYGTNEVALATNGFWYNALSSISDRDYLIRGGLNRGLFYFGDMNMDPVELSSRSVIVNK